MRKDSDPPQVQLPTGGAVARDQDGQWCVLLDSKYMVGILKDRNEHLTFRDHAYE